MAGFLVRWLRASIIVSIVVAISLTAAYATASQRDIDAQSPRWWIAIAVAFAINWAAFIPAAMAHTEAFYDATGSMTFLSIILTTVAWELFVEEESGVRAIVESPAALSRLDVGAWSRLLPCLLVAIWAIRLGSFLFMRILSTATKTDKRFDQMRDRPSRFIVAWTLQAAWGALVTLPVVAQLRSTSDTLAVQDPASSGAATVAVIRALGLSLWIVGFGLEVVADSQKSSFHRNPSNKGRFIQGGVWSWCRHPNYFGEITLWVGLYVFGIPAYESVGQIVGGAISPAFTALLLLFVSGVPLLEKAADAKWGAEPAYQKYKRSVHVIIPFA